jgi:cyclopropane fatty-acyl-phospholipid synthase-like methyltransferase
MATPPPSHRPAWRVVLGDWLESCADLLHRLPFASRNDDCHQETYDPEYYEFIESSSKWSRNAMADSIIRDLAPRNILDVGCGTGALMDAFRMRNIRVDGLEYSDAALVACHERALQVPKFDISRDRLPKRLRGRDVVISFEVAEHLPPRMANRFLRLLTSASDTVVMSAATPGQGGTSHLNEQPHEYWIEKIAQRGYTMDWELTWRWREEWKGQTADWYHANVMVFRRLPKRAQAA